MAEDAWVLIVSGEQPHRNKLVSILAGGGITTVGANTGQEALDRARQFRFRVIITDCFLPDMHALALLHEMKQVLPDASVIVISEGTIPNEEWKELVAAGMNQELSKPVRPEDLLQIVSRFV